MIPLVILALVLSAAALTYETSPKFRSVVDVYTRAIRGANTAHRAAQTHLSAAKTTRDPVSAVDHAQAAAAANQEAAQNTASAAQNAQTEPERAAVSESAVEVAARQPEITDTLADAHLGVAEVAADPSTAVEHVAEAAEANRVTAQKTAEAAEAAQTEEQHAEVAEKAAKVAERQDKIAAALAKLGVGQCGVRSYARVTAKVKDMLLAKLNSEGMAVTGNNPWDIDTQMYGVKLRAVWDPKGQVLKLIVTTGKGILVTCARIWERIDPKVKGIIGS